MNSEQEKNNNYLAAKNFLLDTGLMQHGNPINSFKAIVEYHFLNKEITGIATVSICMEDTFHNGDIEIDGKKFRSGIVHTGFNIAWQSYEYKRGSQMLIIKGSSPLMGKNYVVEISPLYND
jgi:hypothetical protein